MINENKKFIKPLPQIIMISLIAITLIANPLPGSSAERSNRRTNVAQNSRLTSDEKILHVLNRLGYGPRPGDLEQIQQLGIEKYIDQQLHPDQLDDNAMTGYLNRLESLDMSTAELVRAYPPAKLLNDGKSGKKQKFPSNAAGDEMDQNDADSQTAPQSQPQKAADNRRERFQKRREKLALDRDDVKGKPREILLELAQEHLLRAVYSKRQLNEVMVDFWTNHFNVFWGKGADKYLLTPYIQDTIRANAMSSFPKLLTATAQSPAMLFYLDNWLSVDPHAAERQTAQREAQRQARSERQQRRQQRLNRLGRPGNNRINSADNEQPALSANRAETTNEKPAAKVKARKTGLNENYARELMELHTLGVDGGYTQQDVTEVARCLTGWTIRKVRDTAEFAFDERMHDNGEKLVLGVKIPAGGGQRDGERVLDILIHHPSTARFIATKLVRHFVADNPPKALVDRVANVYQKTEGNIPAMLRAIFTAPEFFTRESYYSKVKSPLALVASALRAADAETNAGQQLLMSLGRMGQPLFLCQPPTGYGDTAEKWVNTAALVERLNFAVALCENRIPGTTPKLIRALPGDASLDRLIQLVMHREVGETTYRALEQETGERGLQPVKLSKLVGLLLGSPEFQKM